MSRLSLFHKSNNHHPNNNSSHSHTDHQQPSMTLGTAAAATVSPPSFIGIQRRRRHNSSEEPPAVVVEPQQQQQHSSYYHGLFARKPRKTTSDGGGSSSSFAIGRVVTAEEDSIPLSPLRPRCVSDGGHNGNHTTNGASSSTTWSPPHRFLDPEEEDEYRHDETSATSTPATLTHHKNHTLSPPRARLNSRDIPRTYSGLYGGLDGDLVPFELNRRPSRRFSGSFVGILLALYLTFLVVTWQLVCLVLLVLGWPHGEHDLFSYSWTGLNVVHAALSIIQVHWLKGSMYFLDDVTGELQGFTLWEQLEATSDTRLVRETLMVVPCLLTWMACHFVDYHHMTCALNVVVWMACLLGKLPCMNGVRLFGINRTAGIDDHPPPPPPPHTHAATTTTATATNTTTTNPTHESLSLLSSRPQQY
ncbi:hypothetical protein ACA910_020270 [Epithemia clementina (nom. ined.)]